MKRFFKTAFPFVKFLLLILLPDAIKMETNDYCRPGDSTSMSLPFHALHKDVCPLIKNVLSETTFGSPKHCAMKCLQDPFCAGYNFKSKQRKRNCQLTNSTRHNFDHCITDDKGWIFYHPVGTRKIPCHKMKNCKNGGKTIIDLKDGPGSDPYRCECADGYTGDLCDLSKECSGYTWLRESNRNQKYSRLEYNCDRSLSGWYRFGGGAGIKMSTSCVPKYRCGTSSPGWMNGVHPTVAQGKVTRKVCYHWSNNCCQWSNNIEVVNCGAFYVYKLSPPSCDSIYCGSDY